MNLLMVVLMLVASFMVESRPPRPDWPTQPVITRVWRPGLVWSDEFNKRAGAPPGQDWKEEVTDCCGNEIQSYLAGQAVHNGLGQLVMTARRVVSPTGRTYVSSRLSNGFSPRPRFGTYGRIEARMWLPDGAGLNPAFWTLGDWNTVLHWPRVGEIDIVEWPDGRTHGGIHTTRASDDTTHWNRGGSRITPGGWHIWRIDWRPGIITWYVDGVAWQTITRAEVEALGGRWKFDGEQPQALLFTLAVGGDFGGLPSGWDTQRMLLDWVRWYA